MKSILLQDKLWENKDNGTHLEQKLVELFYSLSTKSAGHPTCPKQYFEYYYNLKSFSHHYEKTAWPNWHQLYTNNKFGEQIMTLKSFQVVNISSVLSRRAKLHILKQMRNLKVAARQRRDRSH